MKNYQIYFFPKFKYCGTLKKTQKKLSRMEICNIYETFCKIRILDRILLGTSQCRKQICPESIIAAPGGSRHRARGWTLKKTGRSGLLELLSFRGTEIKSKQTHTAVTECGTSYDGNKQGVSRVLRGRQRRWSGRTSLWK